VSGHTTGGKRARNARAFALVACLACWNGCLEPAWADPATALQAAETPAAAPEAPQTVPLLVGAQAPFDGILVGPERFQLYLNQTLDIESLTGRLEVRNRLLASTTEELATARTQTETLIAEAVAAVTSASEPGFLSKHAFTIGFFVGVVVAGALVYAAVQVVGPQDSTVVVNP